jgi:large subunit ribosomal protein L13
LYNKKYMTQQITKNTLKYTVDASGKVLGRLASEIASMLLGKNTTIGAKHIVLDTQVEVINAAMIKVTGDKMKVSVHKRYSGYPSGLKLPNLTEVAAKKGYSELVRHAVEGMLPKNKLQKLRMQNLTIND